MAPYEAMNLDAGIDPFVGNRPQISERPPFSLLASAAPG